MKYSQICRYEEINNVDAQRVRALAQSMIENGWQGCPILVCGESLLTGSHRHAALAEVERMYAEDEIDEYPAVLDQDVAEDVTEIVEAALSAYEEENGWVPDIDYSNIGWMLTGSFIEQYKDEIVEW
ncbi:ParB N-terminal domain-containing protein [Bacillota bacterium Meth-B3]